MSEAGASEGAGGGVAESDRPTMHCQAELEADRDYPDFIPDSLLFKWFEDGYSTSKHLLTLYSIARGTRARLILEVGFGRSSFVLARAAHETGGSLLTCDMRDFGYLLTDAERSVSRFFHGKSSELWDDLESRAQGIDFAFLDHLSAENLSRRWCSREVLRCLSFMKTNGVAAFHDVVVKKYAIGDVLRKLSRRRDIEFASLPFNYGLGILRYTGRSRYGEVDDGFLKKPETITRSATSITRGALSPPKPGGNEVA